MIWHRSQGASFPIEILRPAHILNGCRIFHTIFLSKHLDLVSFFCVVAVDSRYNSQASYYDAPTAQIFCWSMSSDMIHGSVQMHVQIEIQQRGSLWYVKGCTVYAATGMMRPIAITAEPCCSRRVTIQTAKQIARQELLSSQLETPRRIRWQVVLWFPERPIISSRPARAESAHQPHEFSNDPSDATELAPTA